MALDRRQPDAAVGERIPHALRPLGQLRLARHVVEHHRPREAQRLGDQRIGRQRRQWTAGLAEADPVAAARQCRQVLVAGRIAQAVDQHVGTAAGALHGIGKAVVARHDRMLAAVLARDTGLLLAGHRAQYRRAQLARPGTDQQAHAAGCRVHQQPRATLHPAQVAQQVIGGDALEQQGGRGVVLDGRGQAHHPVRRHAAHPAVGARRRAEVGHAIARQQSAHLRPDIEHAARGLHARHQRQGRRDPAAPQVDVDEVDADRALPDANLARARRRGLAILRVQHLGAAVMSDHHAARGHGQGGRHRLGRAGRAQIAAVQQVAPQVLETRLVHALRHHLAQLALHAGRRGKARFPMPEGAVAVGHRLQRDGGHVALQRHRRLDDAVGALVLAVRQRQQLFADAVAVPKREAAHAAHLVAALAAFYTAGFHGLVPLVVAVEVAQHRPDALDRRVDDGRANDALQHYQRCPKWRFRASKPPWKTPCPIDSASSRSRSSSHSNSALHSAKQRPPSVTGVSLSVAM
ncbi:hypothetical protein APY03_5183 [Variovorax sp. WDL1]|nr:hypothetical protein APY03_5183 [Variovorax sp. WDL1]